MARWRVRPGTGAARGLFQSAGGGARARGAGGFGLGPCPETQPQAGPGEGLSPERVVCPRASACLKLRNLEDFGETLPSRKPSFVCLGGEERSGELTRGDLSLLGPRVAFCVGAGSCGVCELRVV